MHAAEQDRPDVAAARRLWRANQAGLDRDKLVFVDETGTSTKMARLRGRCRKGQRLIGKVPWEHWKTTFVAGLRAGGISAPFALDGAMNRRAFETYVDQVLASTLSPGDIVVMDYLPDHKGETVRRLIEARQARLLLLPPYSLDQNPIEMAFSKLKTPLRAAAERTVGALWDRVGLVLDASHPRTAPTTSHTQTMRQLNRRRL